VAHGTSRPAEAVVSDLRWVESFSESSPGKSRYWDKCVLLGDRCLNAEIYRNETVFEFVGEFSDRCFESFEAFVLRG